VAQTAIIAPSIESRLNANPVQAGSLEAADSA
jgi:hypothetical protein